MEASGYLPALRSIANSSCAPFWWHGIGKSGNYEILANGTICFVDTRERLIAVTASHVHEGLVAALNIDPTIVCQIGDSTIPITDRVIDRSPGSELDLVTFDVSNVVVGAAGCHAFGAVRWPPSPVEPGEVLLIGGHPGILRVERDTEADLPFQWFAGMASDVTTKNIVMDLKFDNHHQPLVGHEVANTELGGMSGGPVFRYIPAQPIERLELVGFIYEFSCLLESVCARPAHFITATGEIDRSIAD